MEEETSRRLERHVAARVAEVMASDAVQQSLNARLVQERQVRAVQMAAPGQGLCSVCSSVACILGCSDG